MVVQYSVVIPVFNGEKTVGELTERLCAVFEKTGFTYEIIFVDDNSKDGSWTSLEVLAEHNHRIRCIKLSGNFGQHNATVCGLAHAQGNYVVTMDDDLQHWPEDIPKLITRMKETGCKVVIARLTDKKFPYYRRKASDFMRVAAEWIIKKPRGVYLSSFRLLDRQTVREMLKYNTASPYIPALIFGVTGEVANVQVYHYARKSGASNYTLARMFKLACRLLISRFPLMQRLAAPHSRPYEIEKATNFNVKSGG